MKGVKKINIVIVHPNQQAEFALYNSYAIKVNRENKNCYNHKKFRHLAKNCRNRRIEESIRQGRRLEYRENENNRQNNLNKDRDLMVINQVSVATIGLQYLPEQ